MRQVSKRAVCVALVARIALLLPRTAHAEALSAGSRVSFPAGTTSVPLVVTLHGDYQSVTSMHDAWTRIALPRGVAVLSLACPWQKGCRGSFWRWNGAPSWILGELAKVEQTRAIDRDRLYVAGWSGGGTYIGWNAQELEKTFAAIVIHGGGTAPERADCAATRTPVYFLVGDKNPLHALAKNLRDYFQSCGSDVTWDLLKGAEHPQEWAALPTHGNAIMNFLLAHARASPSP